MITLTFDYVNELLDEAVAEKGEDYVYEPPSYTDSCLYVHQDDEGKTSCGCIAANVFHRAGVPLSDLSRYEGVRASKVIKKLKINADPLVSRFLNLVQMYQDDKNSWGLAVRKARIVSQKNPIKT